MAGILTKNDLLEKLGAYSTVPDDESIKYKAKIKQALIRSPELLYALNNKTYESELFRKDGTINWDQETHEPEGDWELYFGEDSNIRPFIMFPETQDKPMNYLCYQVQFDELPRYNNIQKYTEITFTIFVHNMNSIDELTDIPRHDLIASIIRERFNWSNIFGMQAKLISSKESTTDNNYIVKTLVFQILELNGIVNTPFKSETCIRNNEYWQ